MVGQQLQSFRRPRERIVPLPRLTPRHDLITGLALCQQNDQKLSTKRKTMKTFSYIPERLLPRKSPATIFLSLAVAAFSVGAPDIARPGEIKSFCESGFATALQLGAGGAVWEQQWGLPPVDWYDCSASLNVGFLNGSVVGRQETVTSGSPVINANLVLRLPFQGTVTWTAIDADDPGAEAGHIVGAMSGTFVADLNAAHAVVTGETITIAFGQSLHSDPDALITVTETTGKFQSLHAEGDWEWRVSGTITIARVESLSPQINILAALQNSALILGAEEEVVLSGQYFRSSPAK
jgi:hypothetical protein